MIIRWPGVLKAGSSEEVPVSVEDMFPTILEMAGLRNVSYRQTIDGQSLAPLLSGKVKDLGPRTFYWHFPVKWTNQDGPAINFFSAVSQGDWKLVVSLRSGKKELYNIKEDIGETNDLAARFPDRVVALSSLLGERLKQMKTPMPGFKSTGMQVPYPDEKTRK
jgi:arylsulfatase A-like enzyme